MNKIEYIKQVKEQYKLTRKQAASVLKQYRKAAKEGNASGVFYFGGIYDSIKFCMIDSDYNARVLVAERNHLDIVSNEHIGLKTYNYKPLVKA